MHKINKYPISNTGFSKLKRAKIDKIDLTEIQNLCVSKDIIKSEETSHTTEENYFQITYLKR